MINGGGGVIIVLLLKFYVYSLGLVYPSQEPRTHHGIMHEYYTMYVSLSTSAPPAPISGIVSVYSYDHTHTHTHGHMDIHPLNIDHIHTHNNYIV